MRFEFIVERSSQPEHQAVGVRCTNYFARGTIDANSVNAVREHCLNLMLIPGVYSLRMKNAAPELDWLKSEEFDTRAPDQVPSAAKPAKRRKQTSL